MSILINIGCFVGGSIFGLILMSLFVMAGRSDESMGIK